MSPKMVSVITPCYNGERFIYRLLDSVLRQTYSRIEMVVVDDGSTDSSAEVITSYIPRFQEKGYSLSYFYQENSGQSVAINRALKHVNGDYLVWPDSDDFYATDTAISELVEALEESDETVSMARCHCDLLDEVTLEPIGSYQVRAGSPLKSNLFEDCLFGRKGFWFGAGNYMAKFAILKTVIPDLNIYTEKDAGQNWQLMLPLLYRHNCITVPKALYFVLVRADSHSRGGYKSFEQVMTKWGTYERTSLSTVQSIPMPPEEKERLIREVRHHFNILRLCTLIQFGKRSDAITAYRQIKGYQGHIALRVRLLLFVMPLPFSNLAYRTLRKVKRSVKALSTRIRCTKPAKVNPERRV